MLSIYSCGYIRLCWHGFLEVILDTAAAAALIPPADILPTSLACWVPLLAAAIADGEDPLLWR